MKKVKKKKRNINPNTRFVRIMQQGKDIVNVDLCTAMCGVANKHINLF